MFSKVAQAFTKTKPEAPCPVSQLVATPLGDSLVVIKGGGGGAGVVSAAGNNATSVQADLQRNIVVLAAVFFLYFFVSYMVHRRRVSIGETTTGWLMPEKEGTFCCSCNCSPRVAYAFLSIAISALVGIIVNAFTTDSEQQAG